MVSSGCGWLFHLLPQTHLWGKEHLGVYLRRRYSYLKHSQEKQPSLEDNYFYASLFGREGSLIKFKRKCFWEAQISALAFLHVSQFTRSLCEWKAGWTLPGAGRHLLLESERAGPGCRSALVLLFFNCFAPAFLQNIHVSPPYNQHALLKGSTIHNTFLEGVEENKDTQCKGTKAGTCTHNTLLIHSQEGRIETTLCSDCYGHASRLRYLFFKSRPGRVQRQGTLIFWK